MTYIEKVWTVIAFCIFTGWAFIMSAMTYGMLSERGSEKTRKIIPIRNGTILDLRYFL